MLCLLWIGVLVVCWVLWVGVDNFVVGYFVICFLYTCLLIVLVGRFLFVVCALTCVFVDCLVPFCFGVGVCWLIVDLFWLLVAFVYLVFAFCLVYCLMVL